MSWILKHKRKVFVLSLVLLLMLIICLIKIVWYVKAGIIALMIAYALLNNFIYKSIKKDYEPFSPHSNIRNVDYLIIGDYIDISSIVPNGCSYIKLSAPDRGYNSSWQLLRHTHSILKENGGNVVFAEGKGTKDFLVFDYPILHRITIEKYGLKSMHKMKEFPLLIAPISSLKYAFFHKNKNAVAISDPPDELVTFCKERGYNLLYYRVS